MTEDTPHNENESRAPQPHVAEWKKRTHIDTPEETIKRMRGLPERIAKFKEKLRELGETNTR
ncbi:MAG TPA: hypothetical protein VJM12_09315 [Pyrinomonadaceae bacterium]|nr:hypothetical protein [Pyrinomonadaceae bacterium]